MFHKHFFGSTTVGERGQVVIPAEAREKFNIKAGEKMLVFGAPHGEAIVIVKAEKFKVKFDTMLADMREFSEAVQKDEPTKS
ncbi:MAG TPA: AbrB/MazE/SpoVT family DNA-binding domain-containing protein [Candidatus Saccharimonadales bacterium]|nr:AbrB/MazE/SpoVT family DNA-binding domain-containing protein [Candidatus Saccharimonadales bacterium]